MNNRIYKTAAALEMAEKQRRESQTRIPTGPSKTTIPEDC